MTPEQIADKYIAMNSAIESILRVCKGFSLVEIQNILAVAHLNIITETMPDDTSAKQFADRYAANLNFIATIIEQFAYVANAQRSEVR